MTTSNAESYSMPKPNKTNSFKVHQKRQEKYRRKQDALYVDLFAKKKQVTQKDEKMAEHFSLETENPQHFFTNHVDIPKTLLFMMVLMGGVKFLMETRSILLIEATSIRETTRERSSLSSLNSTRSSHGKILSTIKAKEPLVTPSVNFKGLQVEDITLSATNCKKRPVGLADGKVCNIDGVEYYLKIPESEAHTDGSALQTKYNMIFAEENIGITVPKTKIVYEDGKRSPNQGQFYFPRQFDKNHYFASEKMEFTPAAQLGRRSLFGNSFTFNRSLISEKISEKDLAKLAVAMTFFGEYNEGNWGYDKNGLVVIDLDKTPSHRNSYYSWLRTSNLFNEFDLSIDNVKEMANIYRSMQSKSPPKFHPEVDMSQHDYQTLLSIFSAACSNVIKQFESEVGSSAIPSNKINSAIANEIYKEGGKQEQDRSELTPKFV